MTPATIMLYLGIILICLYYILPIVLEKIGYLSLDDYKLALAEIYVNNEAFLLEDTDDSCRVITGPTNKVLLFGTPCETQVFLDGYHAALREICSDSDLDISFHDIVPFIQDLKEREDL